MHLHLSVYKHLNTYTNIYIHIDKNKQIFMAGQIIYIRDLLLDVLWAKSLISGSTCSMNSSLGLLH